MPKIKIVGGPTSTLNGFSIAPKLTGKAASEASFSSTTAAKKKPRNAESAQYPLDMKNLSIYLKEKIMISKIGIENDNYLLYAIKNKAFEACVYLITEVGGFEMSYKNSVGNTALHLAIKTGDCRFVKLLLTKEFSPDLIEVPHKSEDILGNLNE